MECTVTVKVKCRLLRYASSLVYCISKVPRNKKHSVELGNMSVAEQKRQLTQQCDMYVRGTGRRVNG